PFRSFAAVAFEPDHDLRTVAGRRPIPSLRKKRHIRPTASEPSHIPEYRAYACPNPFPAAITDPATDGDDAHGQDPLRRVYVLGASRHPLWPAPLDLVAIAVPPASSVPAPIGDPDRPIVPGTSTSPGDLPRAPQHRAD